MKCGIRRFPLKWADFDRKPVEHRVGIGVESQLAPRFGFAPAEEQHAQPVRLVSLETRQSGEKRFQAPGKFLGVINDEKRSRRMSEVSARVAQIRKPGGPAFFSQLLGQLGGEPRLADAALADDELRRNRPVGTRPLLEGAHFGFAAGELRNGGTPLQHRKDVRIFLQRAPRYWQVGGCRLPLGRCPFPRQNDTRYIRTDGNRKKIDIFDVDEFEHAVVLDRRCNCAGKFSSERGVGRSPTTLGTAGQCPAMFWMP